MIHRYFYASMGFFEDIFRWLCVMVCVLEDKIKAKKESKKKKKKEKQPNFQTNIQELQEKLKARIEELQGKEEFIKVMISIKSIISIDRSVAFDV